MILILGGKGFISQVFQDFLTKAGIRHRAVSRADVDYTIESQLEKLLVTTEPSFLINAAGFTGRPNVDACELDKAKCLFANGVFPSIVDSACEKYGIRWGHVSSGCIYEGTKNGLRGFDEDDEPNFCFRSNNCSFYSGTKAISEECLADSENVFIWRLRMPFDFVDSSRNYLSKLMRYEKLIDATNSLTNVRDFVRACYETYLFGLDPGIYNVVNSGAISTREITSLLIESGITKRDFCFFENEAEFLSNVATPRSNCVLDNSKLLSSGVNMSDVFESIAECLSNWQPE